MARLPIVNPNRFYDNKEIDLVSLLPNNMKETEIETFLRIFETYLNEMYEGATKYVPPENLESIPYTNLMIWTDNYPYVTAPYGNLLNYFKVGDFIRRGSETKYYKISEMIDNSTIKLIESYQREVPPAYYKSAYWDEFTLPEFTDFWNPLSYISPIGMDGSIPNLYVIDPSENRIFLSATSTPTSASSTIGTKIYGDFEFEFSFHRSNLHEFRNNLFGFDFRQESSDIFYRCFYTSGTLRLAIFDSYSTLASGCIVMNTTEDDWVVNVSRIKDTGKLKFKVSSLKNQSGTVPTGFTSAVGFFNRFEYEMDYPEGFDKYITLQLENGLQQGWNYIYLEADLGFKGEVDFHDPTSTTIYELPESMYNYVTQFGRTFESDGGDLFQSYHVDGKLRIRELVRAISFSATDFRSSINHISILEKIRRLTELHDPDLIDIEYIQYFFNYLGYNININRETLGIFLQQGEENWQDKTDEEKQKLQDDYLRFVITNLPTWYKIKTTENALVTMLYSFGLVTELSYYFCTNYNDKSTWINALSATNSVITNSHFQTPHFGLFVDIDTSYVSYLSNPERMAAIIDAILSVKPINTVFHGLGVYFKRNIDNIFVNAIMYANQYVYIR